MSPQEEDSTFIADKKPLKPEARPKSTVKLKTKNVIVETSVDVKKKVNKTKAAINRLKGVVEDSNGELRHTHLTGGEFVVNKESRLVYASIVNIVSIILVLLAFGELIFAMVVYYILSDYSKLFDNDYIIATLPLCMSITWLSTTVICLFGFWKILKYRTIEDKGVVSSVRPIDNVSYALKALGFILVLIIYLSYAEFSDLNNMIPYAIIKTMRLYTTHLHSKILIDTIQWFFSCCGSYSYSDWFQISLVGTIDSDNADWMWYFRRFGSSVIKYTTNDTYNRDGVWYGHDVPFSCCTKTVVNPCRFYDVNNELKFYSDLSWISTINTVGCHTKLQIALSKLVYALKLYHLVQLVVLFFYIVVVDIINKSLYSQYYLFTNPPTAKFPTFQLIVMVFILVILFFFF